MSRREPDEDDRREAIRERRDSFEGCKCGHPDLPGQCPGWRNCPMCATDEVEPQRGRRSWVAEGGATYQWAIEQ